jgi:hypothetical protein
MDIKFSCPPELEGILPPPVPARRALPDWLRKMALMNEIPGVGEEMTVKNCPPFVDAMTQGFVLSLATDISVENGRFSWDWDYDESPISFHFATQAKGTPLEADGNAVIKFINFWTIETPPGWSILFTHPVNRPDLPFQALTGLVDTDTFNELPVHFPSRWLQPDFEGVLQKGTPIVQCIPILREDLTLITRSVDEAEIKKRKELKQKVKVESHYYKTKLRSDRPSIDVVD